MIFYLCRKSLGLEIPGSNTNLSFHGPWPVTAWDRNTQIPLLCPMQEGLCHSFYTPELPVRCGWSWISPGTSFLHTLFPFLLHSLLLVSPKYTLDKSQAHKSPSHAVSETYLNHLPNKLLIPKAFSKARKRLYIQWIFNRWETTRP